MDKHTPEQRHRNMQAIKNRDSEIELMLRKELWRRGLRYQKNSKKVFGHPDVVFLGKKVAVFVDSEFLATIIGFLTGIIKGMTNYCDNRLYLIDNNP